MSIQASRGASRGARKWWAPAALTVALAFAQFAHADNRQLELVPHDTTFYMGTGKPVPVADFFAMVPELLKTDGIKKVLPDLYESQASRELLLKVGEFFDDPVKATRAWGLGDELHFTAYMSGLLPVFRIEGDSEKFESAIANLESEHEINFDKLSHKDIDVRILAGPATSPDKPEVVAPPAAEISAAEEAVAAAKAASDAAVDQLSTATANLDAAKESNDASGIAAAANQIAEAGNQIGELQDAQNEAEDKLVELNIRKETAEKAAMAGGKSGPGFVIAADGKDLVFAMSFNAYDPDILDELLGFSKPEKSIESSGKVKDIRKEWGYGDEIAMFFDFKLMADSMTGGDSSAAKQFQSLMTINGAMDKDLKMMASEPCRSEIRQLAENWPMLVAGNRKFEVNDNRIELEGHFAMLLEHELLRDTLKLVRGVVPASQSSSDAIVSFGVGLNVDSLPQLSSQVTDLISNVNYTCKPLASLNKIGATGLSPLSMGAMMFSGMARGIKGFTVNMYDVEVDSVDSPMPVGDVDAAIAISAEDPATLLSTMRMLPQMSALAELPLDGSAMSLNNLLPIPLPPEVEIFAAVKGKNIVLYSGEQAADFSNRISGDGQEGFVFLTINTEKLIEKFGLVADKLPAGVKEDEALVREMMESYPRGNISYNIDFTDKGVEFETFTDVEKPE